MNKNLFFFILISLILSCTNQNENIKTTIIEGEISAGEVDNVKFTSINDNPILSTFNEYVALIDSNNHFSIEIPIDRMATGGLIIGNTKQNICLFPSDRIFIYSSKDTTYFKGQGSEKNNFLNAIYTNGISEKEFSNVVRNRNLNPHECLGKIKELKQRRLSFLESYQNKGELESEFIEYFKIQTKVLYESKVQLAGQRFKSKYDSIDIPYEYYQLQNLNNVMSNEKIISFRYLRYISNLVRLKSKELQQTDSTLDYNTAYQIVINDSLTEKTQEYVLASRICWQLKINQYDTLAIYKFNDIQADSLTINSIKALTEKYNEKQSLLGKPLHSAFSETLLADTANNQISFGQMMEQYKGNVVFLDIWALNCSPCRKTKPYEIQIQKRLSGQPIVFVYITEDSFSDNLWTEIFNVSLTNQNHYRMINNRGKSKLSKFMEINYVPSYMIFDKQGKLVDFMAERPFVSANGESKLEEILRQLVEE